MKIVGDTWADCSAIAGRYLADSTAVAALLLDGAFRVERVNGAFLRMTGLTDSPVGTNLSDLLAPSSRSAAQRLLAGESTTERLQFESDGGLPLQLTCRTYPNMDGQVLLGDSLTLADSEVLRSMTRLNSEVVNLGRDLARKNRELQRALDEIRVLQGILPICMHCKRIRDDDGSWQQLEAYISARSDAMFSHGLCNACLDEHYPPNP